MAGQAYLLGLCNPTQVRTLHLRTFCMHMYSQIPFTLLHPGDNPPLATSLRGIFLFTRGLGNILSTPISTALSKKTSISDSFGTSTHSNLGFKVADGRYEKMIWYSGSCFAAAGIIALLGWGVEGARARRQSRR